MMGRMFENHVRVRILCFSGGAYERFFRILDDDRAKGIVVHFLADELKKTGGSSVGFVIMPGHVDAFAP